VEHSGLTIGCFTGVAGGSLAGGGIVESYVNFAARKQIDDNCVRQVGLLGIFGASKFEANCNEN